MTEDRNGDGDGVLAIWTDIAPELETEFNEWYWREHLPERLAVPGFRQGWRYRATAGAPRYFAWYALDDRAVLASPAYLARLDHPTEWTRRIMPGFRNTTRAVFRRTAMLGRACGAAALTLRFTPRAAERSALDEWLRRALLPALQARAGIVRAQLWEAAPVAAPATREAALRGDGDAGADGALMIEASGLDELEALGGELEAPSSPLARMTAAPPLAARHRLLCGIAANP